ncbi:MAG: N-acetylmuramoyl-L-alanine amidase [Ilumatobacteraceae bacterium]|nr:N-acetylmuramoyl-L-alanine amidase [Ilumatobacteraceae bacterium]
MSKHITFGRRGMIAAAAGAVAGAVIRPEGNPVFAAAGGGDQGNFVLGSNPTYKAAQNTSNTANVSSVATTLQASANFNNFVGGTNISAVLQIDARPSAGDISAIQALGRGLAPAVVGTGGGYGGAFSGSLAPLVLSAGATAGAPTAGPHSAGELYVDSAGALFYCTTAGDGGTWVELSAVSGPVFHTLPTPERFVDTRSGLGGVTGPVNGGTTKTFQMSGRNGAANNPALQIPDNATTLVGNLTVLGGPNISNGAFVTLWPGGPQPTVSNINVGPGGIVANSFTVGTTATGAHRTMNVFNAQQCDYILDVTGFYT